MRKITFLLFFNSFIFVLSAQQDSIIKTKIANCVLQTDPINKKHISFFSVKNKFSKYNPLIYLSGGLLFIYQKIFSEQIQANCAYEVSCSEFTKKCVQKYGLVLGAFKGFNQLSECDVRAKYDHEEFFINNEGKIKNNE